MKLIITREYRKEDKEILKRTIKRKFGRFEKIKTLLNIKKCTQPTLSEAYLMYEALNEETSLIVEEVIIHDKKVFNALTARRIELLEFLNRNGPSSIKEIAEKTHRDYKNVYDDISALDRFLVLNVVKSGKEKIAIGKINDIRIVN